MSTSRTVKAKQFAKKLNFEHDRNKRSWRKIAQDYPGVNFATLNRIARSGGTWLPASEATLKLLGMMDEHVKPAWVDQAVKNLERLLEAKR